MPEQSTQSIYANYLRQLFPLIGAASVSGLPADILSFPFSRLKTVQMTQGAAVGNRDIQQLRNMREGFTYIYRQQGLSGFYRGLSPVLVSAVPGTSSFFIGMQLTKDVLGDNALGNTLSGFVGQIAGSSVWVPSEVLKELRQMTVMKPELRQLSVNGLIRHIVSTEGPKGLYRGFIPQLLTFGPFNSLGTFLSGAWNCWVPNEYRGLSSSFAVNASAFSAAAVATTPLDVLKTRIQVGAADCERFPHRTIFGALKHIVKAEGGRALFAGAATRGAWLGLRQGIAFTAFGAVLKHFRDSSETPPAVRGGHFTNK